MDRYVYGTNLKRHWEPWSGKAEGARNRARLSLFLIEVLPQFRCRNMNWVISPLTPTQPIENTDLVSDGSLWLSQPLQRGGGG